METIIFEIRFSNLFEWCHEYDMEQVGNDHDESGDRQRSQALLMSQLDKFGDEHAFDQD